MADCLGRVGEVRVSAYRYALPVHLAEGLGTDVVDGDAWFALSATLAAAVRAEATAELPLSVRDKVTHAPRRRNALHPGPVRRASPSRSGDLPARSWTWPVRLPEWSPSAVAWVAAVAATPSVRRGRSRTTVRVDEGGGDSSCGGSRVRVSPPDAH